MKKEKKDLAEGALLRKRAEERLKSKKAAITSASSEADIRKLIHELEVYQIELEMQNQELQLAKEIAEVSARQYGELFEEIFDFSPTGYFSIDSNSVIHELNLSAAKLLGKDRSSLVHRKFSSFINPDSLPDYNDFIKKLFETRLKQRCEARLSIKSDYPVYIYIEGIHAKAEDKCLLTIINISERKLSDAALQKSEFLF